MVTTFDIVTDIEPVSAVTNTDVIAVFTPYVDGLMPESKTTQNSLFFPEVGDITIGGDTVEQQTLDLNSFVEYAINTKLSQGDVSFPFRVDPNTGPPALPEQTSIIATSPQGVLWFGKLKEVVSESESTYTMWGEFPCNFDHDNDISWPKNNAQQGTAVFHITGKGKKMGFTTCNREITVTTT